MASQKARKALTSQDPSTAFEFESGLYLRLQQVKQDLERVKRDVEELKILQIAGDLVTYMFGAIVARLPDYELPGDPPTFRRLQWADVAEMLDSPDEQVCQETHAEMRKIYSAEPFNLTELEFQRLWSIKRCRNDTDHPLKGIGEKIVTDAVDWYDKNYNEHSLRKAFEFWKSTKPKHPVGQFKH
jgi:hypothetical protein